MKQVVLAAMVMMTMAGSVSAEVSAWDYFWGTTLNPANTGWNDFWYQCQDPNKTVGDCIGTVAAGIGFAAALPIAAIGVVATSVGVVAGGITTAAVTVPATAAYIMTGTGLVLAGPGATTGLTPVMMTASGGWVYM